MSVPRLPKAVEVGPYSYEVIVDEAALNKACVSSQDLLRGQTDHHLLTILLDPEMVPVKRAETLLHEVLHGITTMQGIRDDFGAKKEEQVVARIAPLLLDTLRRNPVFVAYLTAK